MIIALLSLQAHDLGRCFVQRIFVVLLNPCLRCFPLAPCSQRLVQVRSALETLASLAAGSAPESAQRRSIRGLSVVIKGFELRLLTLQGSGVRALDDMTRRGGGGEGFNVIWPGANGSAAVGPTGQFVVSGGLEPSASQRGDGGTMGAGSVQGGSTENDNTDAGEEEEEPDREEEDTDESEEEGSEQDEAEETDDDDGYVEEEETL